MAKKKQKNPHAVALGSLGGKARAKALTPEQRKAIASNAGKAFQQRYRDLQHIFAITYQGPVPEVLEKLKDKEKPEKK